MRYYLLLLILLCFFTLWFDPVAPKIKLGLKKWNLLQSLHLESVELPSCKVCTRKLLLAKISYYTFMFKVKIISIHLWDILNTFEAARIENPIPEEYISIQPSINHYMIQKLIRSKGYQVESTQQDLISVCLEFASQVTSISKRHYNEWDRLIEKWSERHGIYSNEKSGTGLNNEGLILRELSIYFDWTLHMYKYRRLVRKQVKEIRSLKGPKIKVNYTEELSPIYDYYESIHDTLFNNTLYLMKKNIDQVSIEIMSAFKESSFSLIHHQYVVFMQAKSIYKNPAPRNEIILITTPRKFKTLKLNLQKLWYYDPKNALKIYFPPKLTGWRLFWRQLLDAFNWIVEFIKEKLKEDRKRMDKLLYTLFH